jgi:superfamily II DNA or RNA helicase
MRTLRTHGSVAFTFYATTIGSGDTAIITNNMERYYEIDDDESRLESLPRLAALAALATADAAPTEPLIVVPEQPAPEPPAPPRRAPYRPPIKATASMIHGPAHIDWEQIRSRVKQHTDLAIEGLAEYIQKAKDHPSLHTIREAQLPVFESLHDALSEEGPNLKGYFSLPTGSGKSFIYSEFIKPTPFKTLIAAPTTLLVGSIADAFNKFTAAGDEQTPVGLVDKSSRDTSQQVTATTYASLVSHALRPSRSQANIQPHDIDLLVLDEGHHALAAQTRKAIALYGHAIQLGFTATENYSEKRKLSSLLPTEIHKLTISEACSFGLICPYSNWVVKTDLDISKVRINAQNEYEIDELQAHINNPERNQLVVRIYREYLDQRRAFVFCSGIQHAKDLAVMFKANGLNAAAVYGQGMRDDEREDIMERARSTGSDGIKILCSDRMLAEGTDIDSFDVALNAVPVLGSYVRAKQRGGRVLRRNDLQPGKHAVIVDIIDSDYRTAPLLFCDEEIGQTAHVGTRTAQPATFVEYGDGRRAELVTNPDDVEQLATDYAAVRAAKKSVEYDDAPEGWLRSHEAAARLGIKLTTFNNAVYALRNRDDVAIDQQRGLFKAGDTNRAHYYDPDFLQYVAAQHKELLVERTVERAPEGWIHGKQFDALYGGVSGNGELQRAAKKYPGHTGRYALEHHLTNEAVFYSAEVVAAAAAARGREAIGPSDVPPGWKALYATPDPATRRDFEHLLSAIAIEEKAMTFNHVRIIDDIPYVSPAMVHQFNAAGRPYEDWVTLADAASRLNLTPAELRTALYEEFGDGQSRLLRFNWKPDLTSQGTHGHLSETLIAVIDYELRRRK